MDKDSKLITEAYANMGISQEAQGAAMTIIKHIDRTFRHGMSLSDYLIGKKKIFSTIIQQAIDDHHESLM